MQKLHPKAVWLFFFRFLFASTIIVIPFAILFVSLPLMKIGTIIREVPYGTPWGLISLAFLLWIIYIIFCFVWATLTYRFWRYQFTEEAIKIEKGVILKKYISIPYERIQNVDIYRGIFERILGLSELHIQTAGYSSYGKYGMGTEGKLPGLDIQTAEQLREELIKKVSGTKQGL